jgi:hypothetical protein
MRRTVLAILVIGGVTAWGQAQKDTSSDKDRPDRASAYYHFMVAKMYAEMAATSGKTEYTDKANNNFNEAAKADPQLLKAYPKGLPQHSAIYAPVIYRPKPPDQQRQP